MNYIHIYVPQEIAIDPTQEPATLPSGMASVRELNIYPLKSGRRIRCASAQLTASGLQWDRCWMLIDRRGRFLSQRTHPQLARIEPSLAADSLSLRMSGLAPLVLPLEPQGAAREVSVWSDQCEGLDQGDAAADWSSRAVGEPVRLVRAPVRPLRTASAQFAGPDPPPLTFTDGYPVLICNHASLEELNRRMPEPIPMERFRPNLVLEGLPAFAEDTIATVTIGAAVLKLVKPCTRCVITATDQTLGERGVNPLPVLKSFRFNRALSGVTFGENAVPIAGLGSCIELGAPCGVQYEL
jgi:uncharacterized protein